MHANPGDGSLFDLICLAEKISSLNVATSLLISVGLFPAKPVAWEI